MHFSFHLHEAKAKDCFFTETLLFKVINNIMKKMLLLVADPVTHK